MMILAGLSALIFTLVVSSLYFYNVAVARTKKTFLSNNPDLPIVDKPTSPPSNWVDDHGSDRVNITSYDGLRLQGYFIQGPSKRAVILAHGYTAHGKTMAGFARFYYEELGFSILMPDARGHGLSEGKYIGFGWHDRLDYLRWIDFMLTRLGTECDIILHGVSMGGATMLMTSGERLPGQVKAVVSDCAYTSVLAQLSYQLRRMYRLPAFPIMQLTSLLTKLRAGYFFEEASALQQVKRARVPMLFVHGACDSFVPTSMVHELYAACPTPKDLYIVPDATHGMAWRTDPEGYKLRLLTFLKKHIN